MLNETMSQKIDRKSAQVMLKSIGYFPELLARSEPEAAAKIVADLIKALMNRPAPEEDPGAALAEVIRVCQAKVDAREANQP